MEICFSLKVKSIRMKTLYSCTVRAQLAAGPGELILPIDLLKTGVTYLIWLWSGDISKRGCSRRSPLNTCH